MSCIVSFITGVAITLWFQDVRNGSLGKNIAYVRIVDNKYQCNFKKDIQYSLYEPTLTKGFFYDRLNIWNDEDGNKFYRSVRPINLMHMS